MIDRTVGPLAAEVPLVVVHVVLAAGFVRLYDGPFFGELLGFVLSAHLLAIGSRRLRLPSWVAVLAATVGAAVVTTWLLFPETVRWGLPSGATLDAAVRALDEAQLAYPDVVAPTEPIVGFQFVAGLALWASVWFADWTAHRLRAVAEAVTPAGAIFVFCSILGSGRYEVLSAVAFAASLLLFVAVQRTLALDHHHERRPGVPTGATVLLRGSAMVGAVALLVGVAVAPMLPGAGSEAALDWRNRNGGDRSRVTVSPMVELQRRLVDQSDQEVFTVRSSEPAYWRLTSLDQFDGEIWRSSGDFQAATDVFPTIRDRQAGERTIAQEVTIGALSTIWAPAAFEATTVTRTTTPLRWDPDSSTLIVSSSASTSDGLTYRVVSRAPSFDPAALDRADDDDPRGPGERYLDLPTSFPEVAASTARQVTADAGDRYGRALALQNWFRTSFTYSLDTPSGHSGDALVSFLDSRVGYCEQFAGAYAAMARSLGMPARVAVGFTPGELDPDDPQLYRVSGRHAHAWPEVHFPGVGWVPFEPTPGRGAPGAEAYTGVAEQQETATGPSVTAATTSTSSTTPAAQPDDATAAPAIEDASTTSAGGGGDEPGAGRPPAVVFAGLVLLTAAAGSLVLLLRRRAEAATLAGLTGPDRAWATAVASLTRAVGLAPSGAETHHEFAERVAATAPDMGDDVRCLAALVTEARWSPTPLTDLQDLQLARAVARIDAAIARHQGRPATQTVGAGS